MTAVRRHYNRLLTATDVMSLNTILTYFRLAPLVGAVGHVSLVCYGRSKSIGQGCLPNICMYVSYYECIYGLLYVVVGWQLYASALHNSHCQINLVCSDCSLCIVLFMLWVGDYDYWNIQRTWLIKMRGILLRDIGSGLFHIFMQQSQYIVMCWDDMHHNEHHVYAQCGEWLNLWRNLLGELHIMQKLYTPQLRQHKRLGGYHAGFPINMECCVFVDLVSNTVFSLLFAGCKHGGWNQWTCMCVFVESYDT